jgi:hypothetical protein
VISPFVFHIQLFVIGFLNSIPGPDVQHPYCPSWGCGEQKFVLNFIWDERTIPIWLGCLIIVVLIEMIVYFVKKYKPNNK